MVQILFILICLTGYQISTAQSDYVVTLQGDTVNGKVKFLNYGVEKKVQVSDLNGKKIIYNILQAKSVRLDNEIYDPVRTPQGYAYMKIIKKGYLSLYAFQQPNQNTWDGRYLLKKDGSGIELPNIGFKKILKKFLEDCPDVTARIESRELPRTKINEIVEEYNNCIDYNTKNQKLVRTTDQTGKITVWNTLETEVTNMGAFDEKASVLEMINEIKSKIKKEEKVPNFLTEGLKEALKDQSSVQNLLEKALLEIKN